MDFPGYRAYIFAVSRDIGACDLVPPAVFLHKFEEMRQFLQTQSSRVTEYDEQMVRRLISKITVYSDKLMFEFKSGMTVELKL